LTSVAATSASCQRRELPGDALMIGVLIAEGAEFDLHGRLVAGVEVGEIDPAAHGIELADAGLADEFPLQEAGRDMTRCVKDDDRRRPGNAHERVGRAVRIRMR